MFLLVGCFVKAYRARDVACLVFCDSLVFFDCMRRDKIILEIILLVTLPVFCIFIALSNRAVARMVAAVSSHCEKQLRSFSIFSRALRAHVIHARARSCFGFLRNQAADFFLNFVFEKFLFF